MNLFIKIKISTDMIIASFKYDKNLVDWIKTYKKFSYNPTEKHWYMPTSKSNVSFIESLGKSVQYLGNKVILDINNNEYYGNTVIKATAIEEFIESVEVIQGLNNKYKLYDFQKIGVGFISSGNKILADDMGLGKTLQSISLILHKNYKQVLIVGPAVTMYNWKWELLKYINGINEDDIVIVSGTAKKREKLINKCEEKNTFFMIYSYDSLKSDIETQPFLKSMLFDLIILDEAHYIKNNGHKENQRGKAVKELNATQKLCLTGTPLTKSPESIWSLLNFLEPKKYPKYWPWMLKYMIRHPKFGNVEGLNADTRDEYDSSLRYFMIRRMKKEVLKDLPEKIFTYKYFELPDIVKKELFESYEKAKNHLVASMDLQKLFQKKTNRNFISKKDEDKYICDEIVNEYPEMFDGFDFEGDYMNPTFKELRNIQNSILETKSVDFEKMPKIEYVLEMAENFIENDRNLILFTSSRVIADQLFPLLKDKLKKSKGNIMQIVGDTENKERADIIEKFQASSGNILIGTIQALGIGVNLTNSDTIIFIDKSFKLNDIQQAIDRIYRIGQVSDKVEIISLVYEDSMDIFVEDLLKDNEEAIKYILSAGEEGYEFAIRDKFFKFVALKCNI